MEGNPEVRNEKGQFVKGHKAFIYQSREYMSGEKNWAWKGGICNNIKEYWKAYKRRPEVAIRSKASRRKHYEANKEIIKQKQKEFSKNNRELCNKWLKKYRHKLGISKKYRSEYTGFSKTKEAKRLYRKKYKYNLKQAGELTIQTIQRVYEDNIKQYGTLTCYLCLKSIEFRQDSLEHRIPLSRGGDNEYNNLKIAHRSCNCKKGIKTEEEYRKEILLKC